METIVISEPQSKKLSMGSKRGRPKLDNPKVAISLRLPTEVLARWKATGAGWQTRMVESLRQHAPKT